MKRVLTLLMLLVTACEEEQAPPPPIRPRKQDTPQARQEATSAPVEQYTYSPVGKRDPFRPYYVDQQIEEDEKEAQRSMTDLEKFELDQLKLVAVMSGTSEPRAMFEDPLGKGWTVTLGTAIGRRGGRITKIKRDEVIVTEEFRDPATNKKIASPVAIRLPADDLQMERP